MGSTIWVDVQGRDRKDMPSDTWIFLGMEKGLDLLAAELGVPSLSTYRDYSALDDFDVGDFDEDDGDDDDDDDDDDDEADHDSDDEAGAADPDGGEPHGDWFDAEPALLAITRIRQHLLAHRDNAAEWKRLGVKASDGLAALEELEEAEAILTQAVARKLQFRFRFMT